MQRHPRLAPAVAACLQGDCIWAQEYDDRGRRRYMTGPLTHLVDEYMRSEDKIGDEVYFANKPWSVAVGLGEAH